MLSIQQLRVQFNTPTGLVDAVKDVSLTLQSRETLGIVGESGSGKSLTALSLMRLLHKKAILAQGQLLFESPTLGTTLDLAQTPESLMRQVRGKDIAMIFQEPMTSLNPVLTCGEQVMESLRLHLKLSPQAAQASALEWFERVKLPNPSRILKAYPHQLSGGQKQRVMIAMALCCNPALLIADEPTTALDVTVQQSILELLGELQATQGMGMLFISHDLGVIAKLADRVAVMYKGQIVEEGLVEQVFTKPQHPYTKSLLACKPPLDKRLHRLPSIHDFTTVSTDANGQLSWQTVSDSPIFKTSNIITSEQTLSRLDDLQQRPTLLRVEQLVVSYPQDKSFWGKPKTYLNAVNNVSFEIKTGETLGLVGESGCGKTTLGRAILRLIPATSGTVHYAEQNLMTLSNKALRAIRKDIQIIFQDPYSSLNPRYTIGEAIMEPLYVHGLHENDTQRRKRVLELLDLVGLEAKHYNRYPHEFSGGQRQRIGIARALAVEPKFIICDECVSALDVSVQAQVLNLLLDLREQLGLTYLFISHDLSVVKFMSDRIAVMNKGAFEEIDAADVIYQSPQSDYTKRLIAGVPQINFL